MGPHDPDVLQPGPCPNCALGARLAGTGRPPVVTPEPPQVETFGKDSRTENINAPDCIDEHCAHAGTDHKHRSPAPPAPSMGDTPPRETPECREWACNWTSRWSKLACPGLDGGDHNEYCDSLTWDVSRKLWARDKVHAAQTLVREHDARRDAGLLTGAIGLLSRWLKVPGPHDVIDDQTEQWLREARRRGGGTP